MFEVLASSKIETKIKMEEKIYAVRFCSNFLNQCSIFKTIQHIFGFVL